MKGLSNSQSIEEPEQQASECEQPEGDQPEEFLDKKNKFKQTFYLLAEIAVYILFKV